MQIADGIHRIDTELGTRVSSLYLFVGEEACLLFDVGVDGTAERDLVPALDRIGVSADRVTWAAISHPDVDHFGGLASLRQVAPQVKVLAHRADAPLISDYAVYEEERGRGFRVPWGLDEDPEILAWTREVTRETPVDLTVVGGERVRLEEGWEVELLHAPGHSRGHLTVWDARSRSLVVSDAVLSDAVRHADGSPAFPPTYRFVDDYLATVQRFESMPFAKLLTAHYPTMGTEDGLAFLAATRNFAESLDQAVLETIAAAGDDGLSLPDLLAELNPRVGSWPDEGTRKALAFPVVGHLERALAVGALETIPADDGCRVRSRR
jgi:glyoxylase-like metal-dependent hydrolase (beta-lactamase superfamily II)